MSVALVPIYDDSRIISVEEEVNARPRAGVAMKVGSMFARTYSRQDYWQTTIITEITDEWQDTDEEGKVTECVRFKTGNSTYIWKEFA
jgi:hypothetical protein